MKKYFLLSILLFIGVVAFAGNPKIDNDKTNAAANSVNGTMTIDVFDTVVFDMSQAFLNGNKVVFPVRILSDDIINALDFSFKFDLVKFAYDSMFNLTPYISPLAYYNAADSTVRFTSFSTQTYANDSSLVNLSFVMLASVNICAFDLNNVKAYLNGDPCSFKLVNCLNSGISELDSDETFSIYPNPVEDILTIGINEDKESKAVCGFRMLDVAGKVILNKTIRNTTGKHLEMINLSSLPSGIYFAELTKNGITSHKKIVKN